MTLDQIRCFIEAARAKSLTKAAEKLFTTQPNITKSIAALERELDMHLFERKSRGVELTEDGRIFLQKVEWNFFTLLQGIEKAKFECKQSRTYVRIGISREELLPDCVTKIFRQENQQDTKGVLLEQERYRALADGLEHGNFDLIITTDKAVRYRNDLDYYRMRPFNLVLAVHRDHPKAEQQGLSPIDFGDQPVFIALPDGKDVPHEVLQSVFFNCGGQVNLVPLNSPVDCLLNVSTHSGVAIISELVDQAAYPEICFIHFEDRPGSYQHLVWTKNEDRPHVLKLRDRIIEVIEGENAEAVRTLPAEQL